MINIKLPKKKTLEECSCNDEGVPVTHLKNKVFCFDDISGEEGKLYRDKKKLNSADAAYVDSKKELYFFEFKNAPHNHIPKRSIYSKMHDSIITWNMCFAADITLNELINKSTFFVIYNDQQSNIQRENESISFNKIKEKQKELAKISDRVLLWDTKRYLHTFYKEIYTIDVREFEEKFAPKIFS